MDDTNKKKIKFNFGSFLVILIFALCILFMLVNLVVQRNHKLMYIFGYAYSVVPTESMEPTIKRDDVVLIGRDKFNDIHADPVDGDIIIYYNENMKIFVIHRAIGYHSDGSIQTKGDNNSTPDTIHVTEDLYRGTARRWGECLGLGKLVNNGRNIIFAVVIFIMCFFMVSEIIGVIKSILKKSNDKTKNELTEKQIEEERERLRQEVMKELMEKEKNKL